MEPSLGGEIGQIAADARRAELGVCYRGIAREIVEAVLAAIALNCGEPGCVGDLEEGRSGIQNGRRNRGGWRLGVSVQRSKSRN